MPRSSPRPRRLGAGTALLAVLLGCGTLTVPQEQQLGAQVAYQMQSELPLLRDYTVRDYVDDIGQRVVAASGPQPFDYTFEVVVDADINAFAAPAGYIYVHTGTILAARNVSELAGVIAHEVGHVVERHIAENYNRQQNTRLAQQAVVLGASMFGYGGMASLGTDIAALAVLNSFGREAEEEADEFAVRVLPAAGYDPEGLLTFFETLLRETGPGSSSFLSSHPATADRIADTRARIAAQPRTGDLKVTDRGRLEIIQRRIVLLTRPRR